MQGVAHHSAAAPAEEDSFSKQVAPPSRQAPLAGTEGPAQPATAWQPVALQPFVTPGWISHTGAVSSSADAESESMDLQASVATAAASAATAAASANSRVHDNFAVELGWGMTAAGDALDHSFAGSPLMYCADSMSDIDPDERCGMDTLGYDTRLDTTAAAAAHALAPTADLGHTSNSQGSLLTNTNSHLGFTPVSAASAATASGLARIAEAYNNAEPDEDLPQAQAEQEVDSWMQAADESPLASAAAAAAGQFATAQSPATASDAPHAFVPVRAAAAVLPAGAYQQPQSPALANIQAVTPSAGVSASSGVADSSLSTAAAAATYHHATTSANAGAGTAQSAQAGSRFASALKPRAHALFSAASSSGFSAVGSQQALSTDGAHSSIAPQTLAGNSVFVPVAQSGFDSAATSGCIAQDSQQQAFPVGGAPHSAASQALPSTSMFVPVAQSSFANSATSGFSAEGSQAQALPADGAHHSADPQALGSTASVPAVQSGTASSAVEGAGSTGMLHPWTTTSFLASFNKTCIVRQESRTGNIGDNKTTWSVWHVTLLAKSACDSCACSM